MRDTEATSEGQATTFLLVPGVEAARRPAVLVELPASDHEADLDADHWNRRVAA